MPPTDLRAALSYLTRTARPAPDGGLTDRQLLDRFAASRDEAAFAALVRRHAPLVLAACRRVLRNAADADDAFQATFLVLARKPRAVRSAESVGPWLYTVALRQAARLRTDSLRRRDRERAAASRPVTAAADPTLREVECVLDEELGGLPARLRSPLVLCYLEARTRDEAARELGWSVRTLQRRLDEGRRKLHARLLRRGVSLPAALLTLGLVQPEASAVRAACATSRGAAGVSARVTALARATMRRMVVTRLAALALVLAGVAGAGALALRTLPPAAAEAAADDNGPTKQAAARPPDRDAFGDPLPDGAVARLGTVRFNHGWGLTHLFYTPDGKTIVSAGNGRFRLWEAATGRELAHFSADKGNWWDEQTVLTADGKELITLTRDAESPVVRVWDLAAQKEVRKVRLAWKRNESVVLRPGALSPDGRRCVVPGRTAVHVFDAAKGEGLCELPKTGREFAAVVFADNDRVVTADQKQTVEVWEATTGKPLRQFGHGKAVGFLAVSAAGRRLATLEHPTNGTIRHPERDVVHVWDLTSGTRERDLTVGPNQWVKDVCFSPDGKLLIAGGYGKEHSEVAVWEAATGRPLHTLDATGGVLAVSPDGTRLATGFTGKFQTWDLQTGRQLAPADSHYIGALTLHLSANGDRVVTLGNLAAGEWDTASCKLLRSYELPRPDNWYLRAVSPDGLYTLTSEGGAANGQAVVRDTTTGRELYRFPAGAAAAFSRDSSRLASVSIGKESSFAVRDAATGREVGTFRHDKSDWPVSVWFAADDKELFVIGKQVTGYEVATGKELFSWQPSQLPPDAAARRRAVPRPASSRPRWWRARAVSPGGTPLVALYMRDDQGPSAPGSDGLVLYNAETGRAYRRWKNQRSETPAITLVAFSPDGRLLATTAQETVDVWEVATARKVRSFPGHRATVDSFAFSADGRRLASGSGDETTLIWDLTPASPPADSGEKAVAAWWADLAGDDAARASDAAWNLAAVPGQAVTLLRQHLRPVTVDQMKAARARVAELDSESFEMREKAAAELERLGTVVVPLLERTLRENPSPETKRRVEQLLEKLDPLPGSGEPLRAWRALAVLERAGTPEAKRLLQELAGGDPDVWLTREAKDALRRLARR